ncbi:MAG TPA: hypothetical protein VGO94_10265 [Mycobacteriales bacterium]|jgi:hypothetical protein|nr:hypothetical protein [Cryptosporangiaceae bacterium]MDQ1678335.1 hypothetical protein [Actinomycetota bacterium]HEV7756230.1 hypothetical protein [Mycobacteriales bacterium]
MSNPTTTANEVAEVRKALATLKHAVGRLRARHGETLGLARLAADVERVGEDLALLGNLPPVPIRGDRLPRVELVQDTPYDATVFRDADDEGLSGMR